MRPAAARRGPTPAHAGWRRPPPPPPPPPSTPACVYRACLAYDGSDFSGWQLQAPPSSTHPPRTVQGELEAALEIAVRWPRRALRVAGAGRTDAGVHARGQVTSFTAPPRLAGPDLATRLNKLLPDDVRVVGEVHAAPPRFSARGAPTGKVYSYALDTAPTPDPMRRRHALACAVLADADALASASAAAACFIGTHDFTHFASLSPRHPAPRGDAVLTVTEAAFVASSEDPHRLTLRVAGNGFLYRQVRHMVGCVIAVARGRIPLSAVQAKLQTGASDPPGASYRGWTVAPAHGLCLESVALPPWVDDEDAGAVFECGAWVEEEAERGGVCVSV